MFFVFVVSSADRAGFSHVMLITFYDGKIMAAMHAVKKCHCMKTSRAKCSHDLQTCHIHNLEVGVL